MHPFNIKNKEPTWCQGVCLVVESMGSFWLPFDVRSCPERISRCFASSPPPSSTKPFASQAQGARVTAGTISRSSWQTRWLVMVTRCSKWKAEATNLNGLVSLIDGRTQNMSFRLGMSFCLWSLVTIIAGEATPIARLAFPLSPVARK